MWKRDYFEHEQEVRLLLIARRCAQNEAAPPVRTVRIDPNAVFNSISFDPRLQPFETREREAELREAGYEGKIVQDENYQKILHQIMMIRDWDDR